MVFKKGNNFWIGRKHTQESREKMSKTKKIQYIGENNPFYGKKHTQETKEKISLANKGKLNGENNPSKRPEVREKIRLSKLGKHRSEETKQKLRLSHLGKKQSLESNLKNSLANKGEKNHFYGKKHTIEARTKNSIAHIGEKSFFWAGGKSYEPYPINFNRLFKEKIRIRDNYTCQICNKMENNGKKLAIHHIDYNKDNTFEQNCISLCNKCHTNTTVNNREHWKVFLQALLKEKYNYEYTLNNKIILYFE